MDRSAVVSLEDQFDCEHQQLSEWAQFSDETRGREREESPPKRRNPYQLDRDRILHSRPFRRLQLKAQVFIEPLNDDTRTRLTHTLEVMQVARSAARALGLNEDLVEAICLGHDIGHTPFAHVGEAVLDERLDGFHHSEQSLRIVTELARQGTGLNLTEEVRDGILKHSKSRGSMFDSVSGDEPLTEEGRLVRYCDSLAYLNHDIDDAIQGGFLEPTELPERPVELLGDHGGDRIAFVLEDLIDQSAEAEKVTMSTAVGEALDELRDFMFENLYLDIDKSRVDREAREVFEDAFDFFRDHPSASVERFGFLRDVDDAARRAADCLSLMTDRSLLQWHGSTFQKRYSNLPVPEAV